MGQDIQKLQQFKISHLSYVVFLLDKLHNLCDLVFIYMYL